MLLLPLRVTPSDAPRGRLEARYANATLQHCTPIAPLTVAAAAAADAAATAAAAGVGAGALLLLLLVLVLVLYYCCCCY